MPERSAQLELAIPLRNSPFMKSMKDSRDYNLNHTRTHKRLMPFADQTFSVFLSGLCVQIASNISITHLYYRNIYMHTHTCT